MQSRGLMTLFTQHNNYNIKSINRAIKVNFQLTPKKLGQLIVLQPTQIASNISAKNQAFLIQTY